MTKTIDLTRGWDGTIKSLNKALYVYISETGKKPEKLVMTIKQIVDLEYLFMDSPTYPLAEYRGVKVEVIK